MTERRAYLDIHVWTAELGGSAIHGQSVDIDEMTEDDFRREITEAAVAAVAGRLGILVRAVDFESAWYFTAHPCRELVGIQQDACGEPTAAVAAVAGFPARRICPLRHTFEEPAKGGGEIDETLD
ncbi:hypothetical protein LCGC14_0443480 [marine sediment metagenome]|uniref:Uncharacterized protein n=1 Tax=marine sediment metagenome TaxID=412755 RepID=A0A0F9T2V7_9ZZZZ